jgi:RIO kinase 1
MRTLYQKCKLVHGDLSEYNILYYEVVGHFLLRLFNLFYLPVKGYLSHSYLLVVQGHLYIIDVSQSVDLDHPAALDFLKEDCLHVNVSNN